MRYEKSPPAATALTPRPLSGSTSGDESPSPARRALPPGRRARRRAGARNADPEAAAAARQPGRSQDARQRVVRPQDRAGAALAALDRRLRPRLRGGRDGAADRRRDLAGHAPVAQTQLGPPGPDRLPGAADPAGAADQRLAG